MSCWWTPEIDAVWLIVIRNEPEVVATLMGRQSSIANEKLSALFDPTPPYFLRHLSELCRAGTRPLPSSIFLPSSLLPLLAIDYKRSSRRRLSWAHFNAQRVALGFALLLLFPGYFIAIIPRVRFDRTAAGELNNRLTELSCIWFWLSTRASGLLCIGKDRYR